MVVKTELCAFSEYRIYPGHGMKFIRRDGQPVMMSSSKCKSLVHQRKKPAKLTWTQAWRRLNKKGKEEGAAKKRSRKVAKVQRAIVGASLEEIRVRRAANKPKVVAASSAQKEIKDRKKTAAKKPADFSAHQKKAAVPKIQKTSGANARGGSKR